VSLRKVVVEGRNQIVSAHWRRGLLSNGAATETGPEKFLS
jgi:hypothetical protein